MDKSLRRYFTTIKCKQRQKIWKQYAHHVSAFYFFAKRPPLTCGCSKKRHGRPKVAMGICNIGDRKRIFLHRRLSREFCIRAQKDIFYYNPMVDSCWKLKG